MVNRGHHGRLEINAIADQTALTDRAGRTAHLFFHEKANANAISMLQTVRDETTRTAVTRGVRFPAGMRPIAIAHLRHRKNRLHILAWSPRPPLLPWRRSSD